MWVFLCFWCKCRWPLPSVNKRKIKNSPQTVGKNKKKEGKGLSVIWKWLFHDFIGPLLFPWPHSFKHDTQQQRSAQAANLTWTWTCLQTDEGQDVHVLPNLELLNYLPGLPVIPSVERNTSSLDGEGTLFRKLPRDVALCSTSQLCTEHSWLEVSLSMKNIRNIYAIYWDFFFTQGPQLNTIKTNRLPQEKPVPFMASTKPRNSLLRNVWMITESTAFRN